MFIDILKTSIRSIFLYFLKFSLTLSKITTVSLIEYPAIVRTAAMVDRENSTFRIDKTPRVNKTSFFLTLSPILKWIFKISSLILEDIIIGLIATSLPIESVFSATS